MAACPRHPPGGGLVTTGPAIDPDQIEAPDRVTVVRSAPHRDLLAHTDVCSSPTAATEPVMKGLVAGVPIVRMPTGRDQPDNAARLTHHGAGQDLQERETSQDRRRRPARARRPVLPDRSRLPR